MASSSVNVQIESLDLLAIRTGLAFFGTPHEGGDERLVALGAAAARIASALHMQPSNDLIETLKKGSLFSDLLAEQWRHHLESYQLVSFWEGIGDVGVHIVQVSSVVSLFQLDCPEEECHVRFVWQ